MDEQQPRSCTVHPSVCSDDLAWSRTHRRGQAQQSHKKDFNIDCREPALQWLQIVWFARASDRHIFDIATTTIRRMTCSDKSGMNKNLANQSNDMFTEPGAWETHCSWRESTPELRLPDRLLREICYGREVDSSWPTWLDRCSNKTTRLTSDDRETLKLEPSTPPYPRSTNALNSIKSSGSSYLALSPVFVRSKIIRRIPATHRQYPIGFLSPVPG